MRTLMGDFARRMAAASVPYVHHYEENYIEHAKAIASIGDEDTDIIQGPATTAADYQAYSEQGVAYDELVDGYHGTVEYRYADFPLALGEALMLNHALFAGVAQRGATPVTDDPFHSRALLVKLARAARSPVVSEALADHRRQIASDTLGAAALMDRQLDLPILDPALPLDEVLDYRERCDAELQEARDTLGWMARSIQEEPWTKAFARELDNSTIPTVKNKLDQAGRARDGWLRTRRSAAAKAAGVGAGAAGAVLAVLAAPVTPIAIAIAATSLVSGSIVPGLDWLEDWRDGKRGANENGLHYLLNIPRPAAGPRPA
jgi:hypothetical protein